jgi:hypothetical protein
MSISHIADAITAHDTASTGNVSVAGPSGFGTGHVATLWIEALGNATYGGLTTAGWVQQVIENSNTNLQLIGFTGKFSDVGAGPWTMSQSGGTKCRIKVSAYAGVDQTNVLDGTPTHSQVNSASSASVSATSALAGSWLVYDAIGEHTFGAVQTATTSDGSDTVVEVHGSSSASGNDFVGLAADSRRGLSAGTQTRTVTFSSGTQTHVVQAAMMLRAAVTAIAPSGIPVSAALGSPTLTDGSLAIAPAGIAVAAVLGSPSLADGSMKVAPAGIGKAASLGTPTVTDQSMTIAPSGIPIGTQLGSPSINDGSMVIAPSGIAATATLGTPILGQALAVSPDGIPVTVALGQPTLIDTTMQIMPDGIAVTAALGTPAAAVDVVATPDGIAVAVGLGTPTADVAIDASPDGIAVAVTLGAITVTSVPAGPPARGEAALAEPSTANLIPSSGRATLVKQRTAVTLR